MQPVKDSTLFLHVVNTLQTGLRSVWSELTNFALAQGTCALRGTFLPGGVDLGFWYRRKDSLISPPLVRAYGLEKDACVPMIALTPQLRKFLANHPHRSFYSDDFDPIPKILKQYRKLPNGGTQWFINYLRICLESVEGALVASISYDF